MHFAVALSIQAKCYGTKESITRYIESIVSRSAIHMLRNIRHIFAVVVNFDIHAIHLLHIFIIYELGIRIAVAGCPSEMSVGHISAKCQFCA